MPESQSQAELPRYDRSKTYGWNYDHAPDWNEWTDQIPAIPTGSGEFDFCKKSVNSPLGIAAGPLLNGKWCLYYAELGFDVLTYKTVRSGARECYPLPNLVPVLCGDQLDNLNSGKSRVSPIREMDGEGTWAVSFGMPSSDPTVWRRDIEATRDSLPPGKILSVSVVGTMQAGGGIEELAADYACCAKWAIESGADCIETNFSCPNVDTRDGQLYQAPKQSQFVAQTVRQAIGDVPFIVKIGYLTSQEAIESLLDQIGLSVDALAMTNSIQATVGTTHDSLMFDGQLRGICGDAIRAASLDQTRRFAAAIRQRSLDLKLIGVGGISSAAHVQDYLDAGAHACHLATSVMINPAVGADIRRQLAMR